jgi:hypothetical protein
MTYIMKQFFYTVAFLLYATISFGQSDKTVAADLKATKTATNLVLTWTGAKTTESGSWQVEASEDGQQFNAIGLVWGADPKSAETSSYSFKQKNDKISAGYRYYRVQFVNAQNELSSSSIIRQTK